MRPFARRVVDAPKSPESDVDAVLATLRFRALDEELHPLERERAFTALLALERVRLDMVPF